MKKSTKMIAGTSALAVLSSLMPLAAHATNYNTDYTTSSTAGAVTGVGLIFLFIFWLLGLAIGVFLFVFWILMIIDVFKRTNWKQENDKTLWIILIIILGYLGAIIYYFVIRRPLGKAGSASTTTPTQAPPAAPAQK